MYSVAAATVDIACCVAFDAIRDADVRHSEEPFVSEEGGPVAIGDI
ncbi:hypothetical protein V500_10376, partial [Pseudogymnoascus sp. VKM F-4518 (FW-2643)]